MHLVLRSVFCLLIAGRLSGSPVRESKEVMFVPASVAYSQGVPYPQTRGPFDFIGNWIQSSEWFPIEINVPDTFGAIGNGVGTFATNVGNVATGVGNNINTFAQNVGQGFQTFTQNVGNGFQTFTQNVGQRFPIIGAVFRPSAGSTQRYYVIVPMGNGPTYDVNAQPAQLGNMYKKQVEIDNELLEHFP